MTKLIHEYDGKYELFGTYETEQEARQAIVKYCDDIGFKSYYWNIYIMPENSEYAGGTHVDYGSWTDFFIIAGDKI